MNRKVRGNLILLATAFIWGTALIFQKTGMQHVGPVTFNCIRMLIGAVVLLPFIGLGHDLYYCLLNRFVKCGADNYSGHYKFYL